MCVNTLKEKYRASVFLLAKRFYLYLKFKEPKRLIVLNFREKILYSVENDFDHRRSRIQFYYTNIQMC